MGSIERNRILEKKRRKIARNRIVFLVLVIIFILVFVGIGRVIYIKIVNGAEYEQSAIENQVNKVQDKVINPNRGTILDRNNQVIAISSTVFTVALDLKNIILLKDEKQEKIIQILSEELEIDASILRSYLELDDDGKLKEENNTNWKIIKKKVPYDLGKKIQELLDAENLGDVYFEVDSKREYPNNNLAAQMVGFIMGDTSWGIESYYNSQMTGIPGRIFRTYEANNFVVTRDIDPIEGNTVVSTIDLTIQQFAEDIVKNTYKDASPEHTPVSTSITVMNPKTGEILAMAQYPNYDLNNPLEISLLEDDSYREIFETLSDEEQMEIRNSIWKNFVISDTFEPGSTFKPMVVAAALEEGLISIDDKFYCEGHRNIGGYTINCHNRDGHGQLNVEETLAQSCNLAMIDIINKLGKEIFYEYQRDFGFGEKTGIDLYGEVDAANLMYSLEGLNSVELATSSFGQGFNTTAIQTLTAFASLINGGKIMKPYVVSKIIDENGDIVQSNYPQIVRKVISEETSDILRNSLVSTISPIGTAKNAIIEGYSIGGKTGTAQQSNRDENIYTLSFVAYLPAEDPEYLAIAIIDRPENYYDGAISPTPMIKELFTKIIEYKAILPSNPEVISEEFIPDSNDIVLGNYTNTSLQETLKELNSLGLKYQIVGSGGDTVVKHFPEANTKVSKNSEILLYVETVGTEKHLQVISDVTNIGVEEARKILETLGFEVVIEVIDSNEQQKGQEELIETAVIIEEDMGNDSYSSRKVYEQFPQAGVYIEKGSTIKLIVK